MEVPTGQVPASWGRYAETTKAQKGPEKNTKDASDSAVGWNIKTPIAQMHLEELKMYTRSHAEEAACPPGRMALAAKSPHQSSSGPAHLKEATWVN